MRKSSPKQQARALDALLTSIYGRHCHGQIGVLDIGKVFKAGERVVLALAREASAVGTVPFTIEDCRDAATVAMRARFEELRVRECQWFLHCQNIATTTTPHPQLGDVPTCERCHQFATKEPQSCSQ